MSKMDFLESLIKADNQTYTENGAGALKSTLNANLDAFAQLGTVRNESEDFITGLFMKAFHEDRYTAMHLLFYIRDIRGGQGARRAFRVIVKYLGNKYPEYITHNLSNFLKFGRADDLMELADTRAWPDVVNFITIQLKKDMLAADANEECSLMAKWLPSENASSARSRRLARKLAKDMYLTPRRYRKILSALRTYIGVVEQKMSSREWKGINYENLPSRAGMIYEDAFARHDEEGYTNYLKKVAAGEAKINAAALYPYDILHRIYANRSHTTRETYLLDGMWKSLPDYTSNNETGICVVDTSGSMTGQPLEVAVSLGLYCADKCRGPFKGKFITFSENPTLQTVTGDNIVEKVRNIKSINPWNTDLEAVFDLILDAAVQGNCTQEDMPSKLYIISDMQFDEARGARDSYYGTRRPRCFMQVMKQKFANHGYELPTIVYWNVRNSKCGMFQDTFEGENCAMVSGFSPSLFKAVVEGTQYETTIDVSTGKVTTKATIDPLHVMAAAIFAERYESVWVREEDEPV